MSTPVSTDLLDGRYRLTQRIATGGMGVVWRAWDDVLGREVAVKLIRVEYADDPTFRQRLRAEARAIASIRSPHVVRIHDVCEEPDPDGGYRAFLVMELLDGDSLATHLQRGPLTPAATAGLLTQLAEALTAAQARQVVHRDIKPGNVILDGSGHATLLDFGIARAADAVALTATGTTIGTARYIAPEQVTGGAASTASDVYALGVLAYECLAGSVPFDGASDVAVALAHAHDRVPPLPADVPRPLAELIVSMLAKDPAQRPSAAAVASAARPLAELPLAAATTEGLAPTATIPLPDTMPMAFATPTAPMPGAAPRNVDGWPRRWGRPVWLAIAAAVGLGAVALLVVLVAPWHSPLPTVPRSPGAAASPRTSASAAASTTVTVKRSRYVGESWTSAAAQLRKLGVVPHRTDVTGPVGLVTNVSPTGKLYRGSTVSVSVGTAPTPPAPAGPKPGHGHGNGPGPGKGPGNGKGHGPGPG